MARDDASTDSVKGTPELMRGLADQLGTFGGAGAGEVLWVFPGSGHSGIDDAADWMLSQLHAANDHMRSLASETAHTVSHTASKFDHADGRP